VSAVAPTPPPTAGRPSSSHPQRWIRDLLEIAAIALVLYIIIWNAFETVRVDGTSMTNTLGDQDLLLASKISYALHAPARGDIVILIPPINPDQDFIKRVIAIPGDQLEIDATSGVVRVMIKAGGRGPWQILNEPYLHEKWVPSDGGFCCEPSGQASTDFEPHPVTLGPAQYFVMGDNRNHSTDSRSFGFVDRSKIVAKAEFRIWPFFHFALGPTNTLIPAFLFAIPPSWLLRRRRRKPGNAGPDRRVTTATGV
jgi:signal peptidase I